MTLSGRGKNGTAKSRSPVKSRSNTRTKHPGDQAQSLLLTPRQEDPRPAMDLKTKALLWTLKVLIWVYDVVTLPIYFLVQKPWKTWKARRTVWAKRVREDDPYSPVVRLVRSHLNPLEGINTMDELFRMCVVRHGTRRMCGQREVISEADEYYRNGKVFKKFRLGDYQWFSYVDVEQRVEKLCRGLLELGVQPRKQVVIFAETRIEWMLIMQTCFRLNVPVATLFATLGEDGIVHGINETEVTHLFTSQELLPKLKKIIAQTPAVTHVVYMESLRAADTAGFPDRVTTVSFSQLETMANTCDPVPKPDPPTPNDIAILMYTSGSTGIPKGVPMTHKNMVTTAAGLLDSIDELEDKDVFIGYLPLAHAFEITSESFFNVMGVPIGYSSPHTMTDKSTAIMPGCKGDATILKPTIMCAVPLMLDRIRKAVNEVIQKKSRFAQEFFRFAVEYKLFWYRKGFKTPILNRLVFQKIKDLVGGKVRIMAGGGAPLSPDTHDFIRMVLDCQMLQAYGMTETSASATIMPLNDFSTGRVGAPLSNCYMRLVDWEEGNYHATDRPFPRGEIVIGGECVTSGYFKNDELTAQFYKKEDDVNWFYTGDIGELHPDGTFKIIDRKKDLVKLQFGEYISLGKVEAELKTCALVDNICVVGNGFYDHLVALVVPNVDQLKALAAKHGKGSLAVQELCQEPAIVAAVSKAISEQGVKSKLARTEIPTKVKLCWEEWQPETGLVTAAFKIRRKVIEQFYQKHIDDMYGVSTNGSSKST